MKIPGLVVSQVTEGGRGAAAALPARAVLRRLRPRRWSSFSARRPGLSSATVPWLAKQWQDDHAAFQQRDLADRDFV